MEEANNIARLNLENNFKEGGPFGAVIVKNNEIIAKARNQVLKNNDPTAHAEINAIREACKVLNTHDLTGCSIYTTCEPCPMCLSAIIWANIKDVYYSNTKKDAALIGFRDDYIYEYIKGNNNELNLIQLDKNETIKLFEQFKNSNNLY